MTLTQIPHSSVPLNDLTGDLSTLEVICVYGVGDGSLYRTLRTWLTGGENRYLIFLEEDEELFLSSKESALGKDPKVRLHFYQEGNEELFKQIAWEFVFLKFAYVATQEEKGSEVFARLSHYHDGIDLLASDCKDMGIRVLSNVLSNQKHLARSLLGQSLKGKCQGIPAIICGAGASLTTVLPQLGSLQDRALIFAGGSAVSAMALEQVSPHFCVHFDPAPPTQRFLQQDAFEIPHFYQSRFSNTLLETVQGALFWMAEGGSYPIERWIKEQYGIEADTFESGWTVVDFCAAIAAHLGCGPIIFVGVDFCSASAGEGFHAVKNAEGKEVFSRRDWMMSTEWLGAYAADHPERRWIHADRAGLAISGTELMSFEEVCHTVLQESYDLSGVVNALVQNGDRSGITEEKATLVMGELKESFQRCGLSCNQLLSLWEKHYPQSPLDTGDYALEQLNLEQEHFYLHFLDPLWQVWKWPILRQCKHPLEQQLHRVLFFKRAVEANLGAFS